MAETKIELGETAAGGGGSLRRIPVCRIFSDVTHPRHCDERGDAAIHSVVTGLNPAAFVRWRCRWIAASLALLATTLVFLNITTASVAAPAAKRDDSQPGTEAPIFVLMDGGSGSILAEKNGSKPFNPGDMTKLMTAEVIFDALTQKRISADTQYPISEHAWQRGRGGSMFLMLKSEARVGDLLRGITVISADDAAIALAEGLAGDEDNFVQLMSERVHLIGMKDTLFSNSTGSGQAVQRTTARDLALLSRHLENTYPSYYPLYREKSLAWAKIEQLNRNPLLLLEPDADGLKAARGTSDGFALAGAANRDGKRLIVVVAGLDTSRDAATEALKVLKWGFATFTPRRLFSAGEPITSAAVFGGAASNVPLIPHDPVEILWRDGSPERLTMNVEYRGPLPAPVAVGTAAGVLKISRNGVLALEVPVYTGGSVAEGSLYRKAASAALELSGRAFRGLWQMTLGLKQKKS